MGQRSRCVRVAVPREVRTREGISCSDPDCLNPAALNKQVVFQAKFTTQEAMAEWSFRSAAPVRERERGDFQKLLDALKVFVCPGTELLQLKPKS